MASSYLNKDYFTKLVDNDKKFLRDLLQTSEVEILRSHNFFKQENESNKPEDMRFELHKLKGTLSVLGASKGVEAVVDAQKKFEARANDFKHIQDHLQEILFAILLEIQNLFRSIEVEKQ